MLTDLCFLYGIPKVHHSLHCHVFIEISHFQHIPRVMLNSLSIPTVLRIAILRQSKSFWSWGLNNSYISEFACFAKLNVLRLVSSLVTRQCRTSSLKLMVLFEAPCVGAENYFPFQKLSLVAKSSLSSSSHVFYRATNTVQYPSCAGSLLRSQCPVRSPLSLPTPLRGDYQQLLPRKQL